MSVCTPARMFIQTIQRPAVTVGTFFAFISRVEWQRYRKPKLNSTQLLLIFHGAQWYLAEIAISLYGCLMLFKVSSIRYVFSVSEWTLKCLLVILLRHFFNCFSFHPGRRTTHSITYHCFSAVSYNTCYVSFISITIADFFSCQILFMLITKFSPSFCFCSS